MVEIGEDGRGGDRLGREGERRAGPHRAGRLGDRRAVLRHEQAGDAIIGTRPLDILLHDCDAGGLPGADRRVQFLDRRLFEAERPRRASIVDHVSPPVQSIGSRAAAILQELVASQSIRHQGEAMTAPQTLAAQQARVDELRRQRGDSDPDTLAAMLDLAEMLWARGRLVEVRALEEHVVAARRQALGEAHGDTLKALGKLATTIGAEGDLDEARRLQEHILALAPAAWGESGRDTLRALNNLAGTVAGQGDIAGARALLEQAIETMHRVLGEADGDTLAAVGNLAAILWQAGERGEAYWLQAQLVETRRRADGADDPGDGMP